MTAPTRNDRQLETSRGQVSGWFVLAEPGSVYECGSGGVLVNVGEELPVWRHDRGSARRLLLECGLPTDALDALP
ncbi:hypothetical protein GCM10010172_04460 [Paractinoplanes ferrugineus]|uniref:Uncharacterized protein n=1 Tax=Paractinoplanes ferrugineus TaxID=113564 RepID=A0A919MEF8_9ACTN|nr:hypothetical protein [Actinoplanes ferrugineus]GIE16831.1 hypothetical protein Afe05nite_86710 [Actinoplanes ferrugineus]